MTVNGGSGSRRGGALGGVGAGGRGRRDAGGRVGRRNPQRMGFVWRSGQRRQVIASRKVAGAWEVSHQSIVSITISDFLIQLSPLFRRPRIG